MEGYSVNTTIFSIPMVKYFISNDRWNRNLPKKRMGLIVTVYRQNQIMIITNGGIEFAKNDGFDTNGVLNFREKDGF